MPSVEMFSLRCSDGYLGSNAWSSSKDNVVMDQWKLLPSLKDGILHIDSIQVIIHPSVSSEENIKNNIKSVKLLTGSLDDIEILLKPVQADISTNADNNIVDVEFIGTETPLFKINDLTKKQEFNIIFRIISIDDSDNEFKQDIYYNFTYNTCTEKGDVNGDGKIDLLDVVALSDYIYENKSIAYPCAAGNDVQDLIDLSNKVLSNG